MHSASSKRSTTLRDPPPSRAERNHRENWGRLCYPPYLHTLAAVHAVVTVGPRAVITAGRATGTYACPVASKVWVHLLES